jgi:hypothetical protein
MREVLEVSLAETTDVLLRYCSSELPKNLKPH